MQRMPWPASQATKSGSSTSRQATARPGAARQNSTSRCRKCSSKTSTRTSQPSARSQAANCSAPARSVRPPEAPDHRHARASGCGCRRLPACRRTTSARRPRRGSRSRAAYSPRRCGRSSWHSTGAPGRHHRGIPRIDHVGQMRFRRQHMHARAALAQRRRPVRACCAASASAEGCCAPASVRRTMRVGGDPAIVIGRADQHIGQHAGLGSDGPCRPCAAPCRAHARPVQPRV